MDWFAINDTELRQFHMAGLIAGGGDSVLPVVNEIRSRKISYTSEAEKPTTNKARQRATREICPVCQGRGRRDKSRNGKLEYSSCEKCGGSGKLLPC